MDTTNTYKEVYFDQYCKTCEHKDKNEDEFPCDECLNIPSRNYSHKPEYYREAAKKVNKTAGVE